jgi:hypothetical protein
MAGAFSFAAMAPLARYWRRRRFARGKHALASAIAATEAHYESGRADARRLAVPNWNIGAAAAFLHRLRRPARPKEG